MFFLFHIKYLLKFIHFFIYNMRNINLNIILIYIIFLYMRSNDKPSKSLNLKV